MNDTKWFDAIHESSHAIVATALGCDVESLNIQRTGTRAGVCRFIPPKKIVERIAIDLAGMEGEFQAKRGRGRGHLAGGATDMAEAAETLEKHFGPADDSATIRQAKALSRRLVSENWGAIVKLSQWLLTHETASGKLAQAIFVSHKLAGKESEALI